MLWRNITPPQVPTRTLWRRGAVCPLSGVAVEECRTGGGRIWPAQAPWRGLYRRSGR
jgi:hypothetical protein